MIALGGLVLLALGMWVWPGQPTSRGGTLIVTGVVVAALLGAVAVALTRGARTPLPLRVLLVALAGYGMASELTSLPLGPAAAIGALGLAALAQLFEIARAHRQGHASPGDPPRAFLGFLCALAIAASRVAPGGLPNTHDAFTGARATPAGALTNGEYLYGLGPSHSSAVTYQPDVILVGGGASSVRSVSADGIVWTILGSAPGASALQPGKILFVTGRGVGRVLEIRQVGQDIAVILGPVDLTDVIRDGRITVDQPLDLSHFAFSHTPELPGSVREVTPIVGSLPAQEGMFRYAGTHRLPDLRLPGVRLVASRLPSSMAQGSGSLPPATVSATHQFTVGNFSVEPSIKPEGLVVRLAYGPSASWLLKRPPTAPDGGDWGTDRPGTGTARGLELGITFTLIMSNPSIQASTEVRNGQIQESDVQVHGIRQIDVDIQAGSQTGLSGNISQRIEVPVDLVLPIMPAAGLPLNIALRQRFLVQTAFTAKNSTLTAHGSYLISGPLQSGTSGGSTTGSSPTIEVRQSLLSSLRGVSVGVNGIVVAWHVRFVLGLGIPAAFVGPHVGLTISSTVTRGSDLGIVVCRMTSVDATVNGGVGFKVEPEFITRLAQLLTPRERPVNAKVDSDLIDYTKPIFHWDAAEPDVKACKG